MNSVLPPIPAPSLIDTLSKADCLKEPLEPLNKVLAELPAPNEPPVVKPPFQTHLPIQLRAQRLSLINF